MCELTYEGPCLKIWGEQGKKVSVGYAPWTNPGDSAALPYYKHLVDGKVTRFEIYWGKLIRTEKGVFKPTA